MNRLIMVNKHLIDNAEYKLKTKTDRVQTFQRCVWGYATWITWIQWGIFTKPCVR